jgi:ribosomal-protein-alanine N-acetyltransferase
MNLIIGTNRLCLREMQFSDAQALFKMDSNPNVHQYLWNKPLTDITSIEFVRAQYSKNKIGKFAVATTPKIQIIRLIFMTLGID